MAGHRSKKRKTSEKGKKSESKPTESVQNNEPEVKGPGEVKRVRIRDDVEFDPADYDGRIERYEQRIREGHSKVTYTAMIESLEAEKKARAEIMAQYPGKDWDVIQRIAILEAIENYLVKEKDPCGELKNVRAIIEAYKNGDLELNGKASYWCQGKMIGGPSVFAWEDFRRLNTEENRGDGGFWVEGYDLCIRLDQSLGDVAANGAPFPEMTFRFADDTGSSSMVIRDEDMRALMGHDAEPDMPAPRNHMMGYDFMTLADGVGIVHKTVAMEVTMEGINQTTGAFEEMVNPWTSISCLVFDRPRGMEPSNRLAGPWPRAMLYVGSAPEFPGYFYASTTKTGLTRVLPVVPPEERLEPDFKRPPFRVRWVWDAQRNMWGIPPVVQELGEVPPHHQDYHN
ncbi:uncharacterized protein N7483_004764 [Penicillium malachiteum]|uniref:uncharacterized protein n=1 Tax=Penicillium malachiteum TaxID=1324776 RepID=UPI002547C358|nr:uncharacterized protein N7483_004764 [Penicillium malachiteum]KAJ5730256.1 hypothetical protein N7483_004764 [Penicillium malachiteum]